MRVVDLLVGLVMTIGVVTMGYFGYMLYDTGAFSTRYAPGYSERGFRGVRRGMSTNEVIRLLGKPLQERCYNTYSCWEYSEHTKKTFFPQYRLRMLCITNGAVSEMYRCSID